MIKRLLRWSGFLVIAAIGVGVVSWVMNKPGQAMQGVWHTQGYGLLIDVGPVMMQVYQIGSDHCVHDQSIPAHAWLVRNAAGYEFSLDAGQLRLDVDEIANPIFAIKLDGLPDMCLDEDPGSLVENFDAFADIFAQNYVSFDVFDVDWSTRIADLRPSLVDETDPAMLSQAMLAAIDGLDDGHIYLNLAGQFHAAQKDPDWVTRVSDFQTVTDGYVTGGLTISPEAYLRHGWLTDDLAYISLSGMDPYRGFGQRFSEVAVGHLGPLSEIYSTAKGLVVDIRWNQGGSDRVSLSYAELFATEPTPFATKRTQISPETFTDPFPITLSARRAFDQPVVLLTSQLTVSAAETFTLAMRELPKVTVLGEPTSGAFSDMMTRELPNGWTFTLSHQVYLDLDGMNHEGVGAPPDIEHPVNVQAFDNGTDTALEAAIAHLQAGQ